MNFNKNNPCPICGKPDYCGYVKSQNGILIGCHRDKGVKINDKIDGIDGKAYILIREKNGTYVYEEENQLKKARLDYSLNRERIKNKNANMSDFEKYEILKKEELDVEKLNLVYSLFLEENPLKEKHKIKLRDEGWTDFMIKNCGFYSSEDSKVKRKEIIKKILEVTTPDRVPGFYIKNGEWTYDLQPGMLLPVKDIDGNIIRIIIKPDWNLYQLKRFKEREEYAPKYISFSSFKESEYNSDINLKEKGSKATAQVGIYYSDDDKWDTIIITEGYKKAKAVNLNIKMPVVALPGVGTYAKIFEGKEKSLNNELKKKGVKTIIIAFDMDMYTNSNVMNAFKNLTKCCKYYKYVTKCFTWNIKNIKGIDDLLLAGYLPEIKSL